MRALALLAVLFLISGCESDLVEPGGQAGTAEAWFEGSYDGSEFVLKRVAVPGRGVPDGHIDLVVSWFEFDAETRQLNAAVSIRNASSVVLHAPARIGLSGFNPESVQPLNAVTYEDDQDRWWYDYSALFGEGDVLLPGEKSAALGWTLQLQEAGLPSFSFEAVAGIERWSNPGLIFGEVYVDDNRNRERDPGEPEGFGQIGVTYPGRTEEMFFEVGESGRWKAPVGLDGLHVVRWVAPPPATGPTGSCTTTTNPLQIMALHDPRGFPAFYPHADFGIDPEPCAGLVTLPHFLTQSPIESIESDPWTLLDVKQVGPYDGGRARLELTLGVSGCTSSHPMDLYFEEPDEDAIQASRMVATIVHDDLDEPCAAYLHTTRAIDLPSLRKSWSYLSRQEGPREIELHTFDGVQIIEIH